MTQPPEDGARSRQEDTAAERPARLIVPGRPEERVEVDAADVRDLGSASRSCLVIIGILLALVLFACGVLAVRSLIGG